MMQEIYKDPRIRYDKKNIHGITFYEYYLFFLRFLKENKIMNNFENYFFRCRKNLKYKKGFDYFLYKHCFNSTYAVETPFNYIIDWWCSKEGYNFWTDINDLFIIEYKKLVDYKDPDYEEEDEYL